MAEVWNVPGVIRPDSCLVSDATSDSSPFSASTWYSRRSWLGRSPWATADFGPKSPLSWLALRPTWCSHALGFRVLTPKTVETKCLILGAALAGMGWTVLQLGGTLLVGHTLRHSSQVYGYFGSVLGLISFLYLAAQLTIFAAEVSVVRTRHSTREVSLGPSQLRLTARSSMRLPNRRNAAPKNASTSKSHPFTKGTETLAPESSRSAF